MFAYHLPDATLSNLIVSIKSEELLHHYSKQMAYIFVTDPSV